METKGRRGKRKRRSPPLSTFITHREEEGVKERGKEIPSSFSRGSTKEEGNRRKKKRGHGDRKPHFYASFFVTKKRGGGKEERSGEALGGTVSRCFAGCPSISSLPGGKGTKGGRRGGGKRKKKGEPAKKVRGCTSFSFTGGLNRGGGKRRKKKKREKRAMLPYFFLLFPPKKERCPTSGKSRKKGGRGKKENKAFTA